MRHAVPTAAFVLLACAVLAQREPASPGDAIQKGEWHTYSGTHQSHRYSPLTQISTANVASLRPVWMYQPPGTGPLEGTPIVANGIMYVTSGPAAVVALSVKSGRPVWQWSRPISGSVLNLGFPRVNRGVAILDETVYRGDARRVSRRAGCAQRNSERWTVNVGDNATGHSITAAPLVADGKMRRRHQRR